MDLFGLDIFGFKAEREKQEVIAFYGIDAYNHIAQAEAQWRYEDRIRRSVLPNLVDDVAGQLRQ